MSHGTPPTSRARRMRRLPPPTRNGSSRPALAARDGAYTKTCIYSYFVDVRPAEIPCVCARLRMSTRAVTRLYDDALRPIGLRTTQFSILARLDADGPAPLTQLARRLVLDRTTLARELDSLERGGLVSVTPGEDRRTRIAALSEAGRARLDEAYPLWRVVQRDVRRRFGRERIAALLGELDELVVMVDG